MKTRYGGGGHILDDQHALTIQKSYAKQQQRMLPAQDSISFYLLASEERMSRVKSGTQLSKAIQIQQNWFLSEGKKHEQKDPTQQEDIKPKVEKPKKKRTIVQNTDQKKQAQQTRNSNLLKQTTQTNKKIILSYKEQKERNKKVKKQIEALQMLQNIINEDQKFGSKQQNLKGNFVSESPKEISSPMNQYIHAVQFSPDMEKFKLEHLDSFFLAKFQFISDYLKEGHFKDNKKSNQKKQEGAQDKMQANKQKFRASKSNIQLPQINLTGNLSFQDQVWQQQLVKLEQIDKELMQKIDQEIKQHQKQQEEYQRSLQNFKKFIQKTHNRKRNQVYVDPRSKWMRGQGNDPVLNLRIKLSKDQEITHTNESNFNQEYQIDKPFLTEVKSLPLSPNTSISTRNQKVFDVIKENQEMEKILYSLFKKKKNSTYENFYQKYM